MGHDHCHDLTPVEFDGEILYPEPIKADDILIDILAKMVDEKYNNFSYIFLKNFLIKIT